MDVDNSITVVELIAAARKLVGTPFLHQGRTSNGGVDCIGLVTAAAKEKGVDIATVIGVKDDLSYGREPSASLLETTQRTCRQITEPIPGCAILFRFPRAKYPHHFALYTEKGTIIHAEAARTKTVVEQTFGPPWSRCLHSIWEIPGVRY